MFQFPSNGKAQRKPMTEANILRIYAAFQFPSNGKAQRKDIPADNKSALLEFQFPSNGKAQRKCHRSVDGGEVGQRFNSLQTGKHSESKLASP